MSDNMAVGVIATVAVGVVGFLALRSRKKDKVAQYFAVLGFSDAEAKAIVASPPSVKVVETLLKHHLRKIPFNNMGMHPHAAQGLYAAVPQKPPTTDVDTAVTKMLTGRGGFCFEINLAFWWLLRKLGYTVRICEGSVVTPGGPVPGHCVLLVEGIDPQGAVLVDPGFGDFTRVVVPMSLKKSGQAVTDELGDKFSLVPKPPEFVTPWCDRFDTVMMKGRKAGIMSNPVCEPSGVPDMPIETSPAAPTVLFASKDDLQPDGPELTQGLGAVLTVMPENMFSQKVFAVYATDTGFKYLGGTYTKEKSHGVQVARHDHGAEGFREACDKYGLKL